MDFHKLNRCSGEQAVSVYLVYLGGVKQGVIGTELNVKRSQVDWQNGYNQIFIKHDFLTSGTPRVKNCGKQ